jgi:universal stress protein E
MKSIRKILVVADPAQGSNVEAQRAVRRGFGLAEQMNAELRLVFVCDYSDYLECCRSFDPVGLEKGQVEYSSRMRGCLQEMANALATPAVRVSIELVWDRPWHDGIVREVLRYEPDLVIKDTHPHSVLARALFTNTDWHLIRECPAPLMLVRSAAWPRSEKVVAAVDPFHENDKPAALDRKIIDTASHLARAIGGELHVVHVFEPRQAMVAMNGVYVPWPVEEITQDLRARHVEAVQALASGLRLPRQQVHMREGIAHKELCGVARELNATILVMGAIARTRFERVLLGSTAEPGQDPQPGGLQIVKPAGIVFPRSRYAQQPGA